eukprot:12366-Heterococcus_DN1.PRE.1
MNRRHKGRLLAWGTGANGQLGLERTTAMTPTLIPTLENVSFKSIAAGRSHVVAVATDGRLFTWATVRTRAYVRQDANLIHIVHSAATTDRFWWIPTVVAAFAGATVQHAAAGAAHTLAIASITPTDSSSSTNDTAAASSTVQSHLWSYKECRKATCGNMQCCHCLYNVLILQCIRYLRKAGVYTWGRGAHGRLGLGDTYNRPVPCQITQWPMDSFTTYTPVQAALGGAHTLLLATRARTAPAHIADNSCNQDANSAYRTVGCPWGSESVVLAFGYGANGQCGTGLYEQNGLLPLR